LAATIEIREFVGANEAAGGTVVTAVRYCTNNTVAPGTNDPCVRPASGTNYSYEKYHALWCGATGPSGTISNIKWYPPDDKPNAGGGAIAWTGVDLYVGTADSYTQPAGTVGTSGTLSTIATTDAFATYDSASMLSVGLKSGYTNGADTRVSDFVVTQMRIGTTAGPGTVAAATITIRYDET
jgi:hypothetical protein